MGMELNMLQGNSCSIIMASEEARDWRNGLSVLERQRYMYEGKIACDVIFMVGKANPEKISAHKFVLVCGSPIFEAMLTEGPEGDIVVGDVEPEVFNAVLKFLYCEQIELKADTAMNVLQAARRYEVSHLVVKCTDYLMGTIAVRSVCLYLSKSVQYDENELSAGCMDFISHNTKQVFDSTEFTQISPPSLKMILETDLTDHVLPQDICTACLRWADAQCAAESKPISDENRRAMLGSCLYLICFPNMSLKDFTEVTRKSNLLTCEERAQIYEYIDHREHGHVYEGSMVFKVEEHKPRQELKVKRFKSFNYQEWDQPGTSAIDFLCSRSVWITGVGLYVGNYYEKNNVVVKLMDDEGEELADTGKVVMDNKRGSDTVSIKFTESIKLRGNHTYRISAVYKCKPSRYGEVGQETVEVGGVYFTFRQTPGNKTTVYEGQIPEIMFVT